MPQLEHTTQFPEFEVTIGGTTLTQKDSGGLVNLVVEDHVDMMGMAQITVDTGHLSEGQDFSSFKIGDEVKASFGGGGGNAFVGLITGMRHAWRDGSQTVTITAMDPTSKLAASRHTQTFESMTDSEIFEKVVGDAGLEVGKVDATSGASDHVAQRNESDLNFLKRLAARNGYQVMSTEGKIDFIKPSFTGDTIEVDRSKLTSMDFEFSDQQIPAELTVIGWDPVTKAKVEGTATKADIESMGSGEGAVDKTGPVWSGTSYITDVQVTSQEAAKAMAVGELNRLARNFLRGRASVSGTGELKAGCTVKFTGQHKGMAAEGYVISVRHSVESGGLHTSQIIFCSNSHTT